VKHESDTGPMGLLLYITVTGLFILLLLFYICDTEQDSLKNGKQE